MADHPPSEEESESNINDAHIKTSISRYDNGAYTRIQFQRATSYNVGAHSALVHETNSHSNDNEDRAGKNLSFIRQ